MTTFLSSLSNQLLPVRNEMTVSYSGSFFSLLLRWKGSIWRSVWRELVVFLMLFYSIRFTYTDLLPLADPDGTRKYRETFATISRQLNEYTKMIPLTFLLGFYVSNVVSRWWRQFECLSWPEDLLSVLCLVLPSTDLRTRHIRHQIARYLNLTAALAWRDISCKIRLRFPTMGHLVDGGLMTENELARLQQMQDSSPGIGWLTPIHWSQQLIAAEVSAGRAQTQYMSTLSNELKQFRVSFRRLFCHDWVCVPLVYTQVAALATYSFFFFCLFGRQFLAEDDVIDLYVPIFTIVQFLFFVGWFKVGQDLMRPFGLDDDDIELSYILDRNLVTSFAVVDCLQTAEPPPFEEDVFWLQKSPRQEGSDLLWGRIDLTRSAHKHPPKLHTYVELGDDVPPEHLGCIRAEKRQKFISW